MTWSLVIIACISLSWPPEILYHDGPARTAPPHAPDPAGRPARAAAEPCPHLHGVAVVWRGWLPLGVLDPHRVGNGGGVRRGALGVRDPVGEHPAPPPAAPDPTGHRSTAFGRPHLPAGHRAAPPRHAPRGGRRDHQPA